MLFIADQLFSQLILVTLVVIVWRSLWNLENLLFYPDDYTLSALVSLAAGVVSCLIVAALQFPLADIAKTLQKYSRFWIWLTHSIFNLIGIFGVVSFWRGLWNIQDLFIDSTNSNWAAHGAAIVAMMITFCSRTLTANSILVDAEKKEGLVLDYNFLTSLVNVSKQCLYYLP